MSSSLEEQLEELLAPLQDTALGVAAPEGPEQLTKIQELLASTDDPTAGFAWLAERAATLPATAGSWIAVYLGGLVERGRLDASMSAPGVLALFARFVDGIDADGVQTEWEACAGLIGPTIVTHLSAAPATLGALRDKHNLCSAIAARAAATEACWYVDGLIRQHSGSLHVVDFAAKRGLLVKYSNLSNCNHLFTLLQSVLSSEWSQGRTQSPEMLAVAWGENPVTNNTPGDQAWFLYQQLDGSNPLKAVAGSASPASISTLGEHRVVLVGTNIGEATPDMSQWEATAFAPQLPLTPPTLSVQRELERSEIITLLGQLPEPVAERPVG